MMEKRFTGPQNVPNPHMSGVPCIRGTFLDADDVSNSYVRPYRVIFNCDGWGVFVDVDGDRDKWLRNIFDPLEGTHVDALFWNDGSGGNTARYASEVLELAGKRFDKADPAIVKLIQDGDDPPNLVVREAKKRNLDVFWSYRLNDVHDVHGKYRETEFPLFKEQHPEWMIGPGHLYGRETTLNFAIPEVRQLKLEVLQEIARKYDLDGIEIDFMRSSPHFKPGEELRNAPLMTEFVRSVRDSLKEQERRRGRPFRLAVRVNETIEGNRLDGLEVEKWVEEELLDILILSSGAMDMEVGKFTRMVKGTGIQLYACVYGYPGDYDPSAPDGLSPEMVRGLALNHWSEGVDGIYLFNWFIHDAAKNHYSHDTHLKATLSEIGDRRLLDRSPVMFPAENALSPGSDPPTGCPHGYRLSHLPVWLAPGEAARIPVFVGKDLSVHDPEHPVDRVEMRIVLNSLTAESRLSITLNNTRLAIESQAREGSKIRTSLKPEWVQRGRNWIELELAGTESVLVKRAEIWVDHRHKEVDLPGRGEEAGEKQTLTNLVRLFPTQHKARAYCTLFMPRHNPVPCISGSAYGAQIVSLGELKGDTFTPALTLGLQDRQLLPQGQTQLVPWAFDGKIDYYGGYARPQTPYDFRVELDLDHTKGTVWARGRGDDQWYLLAEGVPLMNPVPEINAAQIQQFPGAAGVSGLRVQSKPWDIGEKARLHPLAKKQTVSSGKGFQLQSMRSLWHKAGTHVTISRDPDRWQGFPDVVLTDSAKLLTTYCDGVGHGGGGKAIIRESSDMGLTWGPERVMVESGGADERLQKLKDGSLLYTSGERANPVVFKRSVDDGQTWEAIGGFDCRDFGIKMHYCLSHVLECSDGAWLVTGSDQVPENKPAASEERVQVYRSLDRGKTWHLLSIVVSPRIGDLPYRGGSESSILELPDGRIAIYVRESRTDGYPAFRVLSADGGKTWSDFEDLPVPAVGRVHAGLLHDGRVLMTSRVAIGRRALWAWAEDPTKRIEFGMFGAHFNDHRSKGLKDGVLYIDNDGMQGQFTRYHLRPPKGLHFSLDLKVDVKVLENTGKAATISVPFVGRVRVFPDRVDFVGKQTLSAQIVPGVFHTYRLRSDAAGVKLYVDDCLAIETSNLDDRTRNQDWTYVNPASPLVLAFGNEPVPYEGFEHFVSVFGPMISPDVTGLSLWKNIETTITEDDGSITHSSWSAKKNGFPDQYQLDHIIEVNACAQTTDVGYSGWKLLPDGRVYVINYTDDTARQCGGEAEVQADAWNWQVLFGVAWIRGTYVRL